MSKQRGRYSPENPSYLSTSVKARGEGSPGEITSCVVGSNADLMVNVEALWFREDDFVVDATWGKGNFWKKTVRQPDGKHDLILDGVLMHDLPYENESVDVVVVDPPYRPNHGSKRSPAGGLHEAYQVGAGKVDTINDVLDLYSGAIIEAYRIVKPGGLITVKCQDLSYSSRLHMVTIDILNMMLETGWDFGDQFILMSNSQIISSKWVKQQRARRSHSVMWVGVKP